MPLSSDHTCHFHPNLSMVSRGSSDNRLLVDVQQQPQVQYQQPQYAQPTQPQYAQPTQPQYAQPAQPQYAQPTQRQYVPKSWRCSPTFEINYTPKQQ